ncbi:cation:proton antiporter [Salinisphaera sp. RV14]|uniref:cation:proton antiporter n=1 Tax=Salinisphaera sp. RV14 TaxID=3454140 RepID=UPI003F8550CA
MRTESVVLLMFLIASGVAIAARRLNIPYTVALVPVGLLLGALHLFNAPALTREMLFLIFLPGLVFEAAFHIHFENLWRDRLAVLALAIPGVLLAIALTAALLVFAGALTSYLPHVGWALALLFGAAIAATDPISVVALFRELGAPARLTLLVEGESLLNDGTSIVFFSLILAVLMGQVPSGGALVVDFAREVGGGVVVGLAIGLAASQVVRYVDAAMVEVMLMTVAAYGSFLAADQLGVSGVISTVAAGLVCGNYGARRGMSPTTYIAVRTFWDYLGFALNSLIFLFMGFAIHLRTLLEIWPIIVVAYLAVTLARGLVIFGISGVLAMTRARIPRAWTLVLTWGGLRGALSMVLVLSLPDTLPLRNLIVNMVFGVVLVSILVQGLTMTPLARWLGVVSGGGALRDYELARARRHLADAVLAEISGLQHGRLVEPEALDAVKAEYEQRASEAEAQMTQAELDREHLLRQETVGVRRRLLLFERQRLREARDRDLVGEEVYNQLLADVDARLLACDNGHVSEQAS